MSEEVKTNVIDFNKDKTKNISSKKDFKNYDEMFNVLEADSIERKRNSLSDEERKTVGIGDLPKLSKLAAAGIFMRHFNYCIFGYGEDERLAFYIPFEGIYTQNYGLLKRIISYIEPALTESQAETVIYHIKNKAKATSPLHESNLIPVGNGIFNLKTHELMPFSPNHIFLTKIKTNYIENPIPPNIDGWTFDNWLSSIACGDQGLIKLMWQVINEACNGNSTRKMAVFLVGNIAGNNGKGTFQDLIENLIGSENTGHLKVNDFDKKFRLAALVGKTVCIGDDVPADVYIKDSSNFNSVVTGDPISIEFKGKDAYSTRLMCLIIQSCNGMPNFHNKGGTMRRLMIIPFNAHFSRENDNEKIKFDYLKRKDVLEYVLFRALEMDFKKFDIPSSVEVALKDYEVDNDPLVDFKENIFNQMNISKIPTMYLYKIYEEYCKQGNYKPLQRNNFTKRFNQIITNYETKPAKYNGMEIDELKSQKEKTGLTVWINPPTTGKSENSFVKKA